jgi:hypothetical protein
MNNNHHSVFFAELTQLSFIDLFEVTRRRTMTQEGAYEICEEVHQRLFNKRKYSDFYSFYSVFNRHIKNIVNKNNV